MMLKKITKKAVRQDSEENKEIDSFEAHRRDILFFAAARRRCPKDEFRTRVESIPRNC